jgi:hypothetical protein
MKTYNIFISHSWTYWDAYNKLSIMLKNWTYFNYKDYSVPRNNPIHNANNDYQLENAIRNQIRPCSVVIILAWVYATYSKWIKKEIKIAKELWKPILAIQPWGAEKTSQIVKNNANKIVWWNWHTIISAIKEISI